ncbi:CDP-glycerol glycerophosphotransferase family protein [Vagococcus salmoninarum]|uniref:CDP-glycerol glycerophosphotransferase family protein n=1 Tax=Vagococcus salmoninarum TaxID=2739 RepID=UPI00398A836F
MALLDGVFKKGNKKAKKKIKIENNLNTKEKFTYDLLGTMLNKDEAEIQELLLPLDDESHLLINNSCSKLEINGSNLEIEGSCYFTEFEPETEEMISRRLLFMDGEEIVESVALESLINPETDKWDQYRGNVLLSKITKNNPLKPGKYEVLIELQQFINSKWLINRSKIGRVDNIIEDFVYSSKMESYSAKSNKIYSLVLAYDYSAKTLFLESKKLSDINPAEYGNTDIELDSAINRKIKKLVLAISYQLFKLVPVKSNKVSFVSDSRIDISGNFEFIYEELLARETNYKINFYLKNSIKEKKSYFEILSLAFVFATSRYIILDDFYPLIYPLKIRKKTELVQVWHAVGAFKTFGYSRVGMPGGPSLKSVNHKNYTKVLVSSQNIAPKYAEGFGIQEYKVIPLGIPRTDLFFDELKKEEIKNRLSNELPFINGKKVILFAPTFRGNGQQSAHYPYEMLNFKKIYEEFKDNYVFLLKIHPFVQNIPDISYEYSDFYYDVSDYREINDLLLITDCLITDYSSVCFEYALLKKPMVFFCPDLSEYMITRNFYYDYFDFIPGTLASNTTQLIEQILEPKIDEEKLNDFVNYYFDDIDGNSSKRLVDAMLNQFEEFDDEEIIDEFGVSRTEDGKIIPKWGK